MPVFDDDAEPRRPRAGTHVIGQDLGAVSVDELRARVEDLRQEIARIEREIAAKTAQRGAADMLFKR